jgi:hypothetical protein
MYIRGCGCQEAVTGEWGGEGERKDVMESYLGKHHTV